MGQKKLGKQILEEEIFELENLIIQAKIGAKIAKQIGKKLKNLGEKLKKKRNCQKLYFQVEIGVKMAKNGPKIKIENDFKLKLVQKLGYS